MTENMIRILCVFSKLDYGGAETMCMNLYRNLDREKIQFDFVKHTHDICAYEEEISLLGGKIYEAPVYRIYNHSIYCEWWKNHLRKHTEHRVIHGHYSTVSSVYFRLAKRMGRITVGHSHSANPQRVGLTGVLKEKYSEKTEKYSDYALACGEKAGKWLFPHKKFYILNNAIETEKFLFDKVLRADVRRELGYRDEIVVGTVGRLNYAKNPFGILEIIENAYNQNSKVRFLWIGEGELKSAIHDQMEQKGLSKCICMVGNRQDVNRMMQAMDIFILPSIFEGLPTSVIEAQAAGLPCLISDTVSKEADITGLCKFLPIENYHVWANEIQKMDIEIRQNMKEKIVDAGYDIKTTARWIQDFYMNIG